MDFANASLAEVVVGLEKGEFGSRDVVDACLAVAKKNGERTHAYVQLFENEARRAADEADARRRYSLRKSPLDGVPVAIKDNMMLVGSRTTAGSAVIASYESPYDATVVRRLRDAGAIFLGKTNLDEFAMGSSTETSVHGPTKNPWDVAKIPGGSSGGSAVAVAEGSAVVALGSDTGGSIRQPAAMCGVVGLKPTYGRVSRYGLIAMASSLDQIGPITKTVEDAAITLAAIEGRDPMDSTSVDLQRGWDLPSEWPESLKGMRIGMPKEYFVSGMDAGVETAVRGAVATLERLGATVKEVSLPHAEHALAVYYVLMPSEVSANLARFDGIRFGTRKAGETLEATYRRSRGEGFGKEVRRRIMLGTYALSSGYYDAYYLKALKVRRLIADDFSQAFQDVDCIVTPTSPTVAWNLGEKADDPLSMYLADIYTVSVNVAGLPAISVPCGLAKGLPVGLQIIGRHFDEKTILTAAKAYESAAGLRASMRPPSV
ncbi:MAG: glutamyl-tRNA(Gln) amidotransferase, subunit [Candidatus Parcubacteria bacterium]